MKEKELVALGFERVDVSAEDSGDKAFHYYTYDFGNRTFALISNANDEAVDDNWYVEVFEDETIRFTNSSDVMGLIDVINRNTINEKV